MFRNIIFVIGLCWMFSMQAQETAIDLSIKENIKKSVIKNIALSRALLIVKYLKKKGVGTNSIISPPVHYPDFGFQPEDVDCTINELEDIKYPNSKYTLYEVKFTENERHKRFQPWGKKGQYLVGRRVLIGINDNEEIKFISGAGINHSIARDFKLKKSNVKRYCDFLSLKLFNFDYDSIEFLRKETGVLVFLVKKKFDTGLTSEHEYYLSVDNPELFKDIKYVRTTGEKNGLAEDEIDESVLLTHEEKKKYLLNSIMKNAYIYKMFETDDLYGKANIDTLTWMYKDDSPMTDNMLPDYNDFWERIEAVEFDMTEYGEQCRNKPQAAIQKYITGTDDVKILGSSVSSNIELYYFYKDTLEILATRREGGMRALGCCKYDFFYNKDDKLNYENHIKKEKKPPYPPQAIPPVSLSQGDECNPFIRVFSNKWEGRLDYYLVAINVQTKEVFFVSGKNIFLGEIAQLYPPMKRLEPVEFSSWPWIYQTEYIKNRLYSYQVKEVNKNNIISKNKERLQLAVVGKEYGSEINLHVELDFNDPEFLKVTKE